MQSPSSAPFEFRHGRARVAAGVTAAVAALSAGFVVVVPLSDPGADTLGPSGVAPAPLPQFLSRNRAMALLTTSGFVTGPMCPR